MNISTLQKNECCGCTACQSFNEMAMKDLGTIKQVRKQKKIETKQVRYE